MMNKKIKKCLNVIVLIAAVLVLVKCQPNTEQENLAAYVGNVEKGLTKKINIDGNDIVCQLIPEQNMDEKRTGNVFRFNVYLNTKQGKISDSTSYKLNYHAVDLFALALGEDTIKPVLSERIANGRRDLNQFTVIFDADKKGKLDSNIFLIIRKNDLLEKETIFSFSSKDFKKAIKQLYGYDQNND